MDESRALEALTEILARPELNPPPVSDPWQAFWSAAGSAVWRLLQELFGWLVRPVGEALAGRLDWIGLGLVALAAAVLVAGAWLVLRAVRLHLVADTTTLSHAQALRRARADRLWREAHDLAAAGDLAAAVRALYLSALYALEEREVLAVQEALTNREHADRLTRVRPDAALVFAEIVGQYDRLRYGGTRIDHAAFEALRALVTRARALGS